MAESLSNQMKELSLELIKLRGESLETGLNFHTTVKDCFLNAALDQHIVLRFVYGKICIKLFFLSEKGLREFDVHKVCSIAEDCFEQKNKNMHSLSWCVNYKTDQQQVEIRDLNYWVIFTYINDSKACWTDIINSEEEGKLSKCFLCKFYS